MKQDENDRKHAVDSESEVVLSVRNLSIVLAGNAVISGLTFAVKRGVTLAIIGPNGSGRDVCAYAVASGPLR